MRFVVSITWMTRSSGVAHRARLAHDLDARGRSCHVLVQYILPGRIRCASCGR